MPRFTHPCSVQQFESSAGASSSVEAATPPHHPRPRQTPEAPCNVSGPSQCLPYVVRQVVKAHLVKPLDLRGISRAQLGASKLSRGAWRMLTWARRRPPVAAGLRQRS